MSKDYQCQACGWDWRTDKPPVECPRCYAGKDDILPLKEDLRMTDLKLPLCEIGPAGRTRMSVQNYYDGQRKLGISIRDAMRGTEFALNIRNLQTDASGKTIVYFEESTKLAGMLGDGYKPLVEDDTPESYARAINSTTDSWNKGFMSEPTWKKHVVSLWGTVQAKGLTNGVKPLVTSKRALSLAYKVQTGLSEEMEAIKYEGGPRNGTAGGVTPNTDKVHVGPKGNEVTYRRTDRKDAKGRTIFVQTGLAESAVEMTREAAVNALYLAIRPGLRYRASDYLRVEGNEVSVRHWGDWIVPPGEEDDGDYDWRIPTKATADKATAICKDIEKRYAGVKCTWSAGEKDWLYFEVK